MNRDELCSKAQTIIDAQGEDFETSLLFHGEDVAQACLDLLKENQRLRKALESITSIVNLDSNFNEYTHPSAKIANQALHPKECDK